MLAPGSHLDANPPGKLALRRKRSGRSTRPTSTTVNHQMSTPEFGDDPYVSYSSIMCNFVETINFSSEQRATSAFY